MIPFVITDEVVVRIRVDVEGLMPAIQELVQKIKWRLRGRRYLSFRDVNNMAEAVWETGKTPRWLKMAPDVVLEMGEWSMVAKLPSALGILEVRRDPRLEHGKAEVK